MQTVTDRETAVFGTPGRLARAAAEGLYRVMAYKDEYEVARLHTAATSGKARVHMSPPLITGMDKATDGGARLPSPAGWPCRCSG